MSREPPLDQSEMQNNMMDAADASAMQQEQMPYEDNGNQEEEAGDKELPENFPSNHTGEEEDQQ